MHSDVIKALSLVGVIVTFFFVVQSGALTVGQSRQAPPVASDPATPHTVSPEEELTLEVCSACHGLNDLDGKVIVAGRGVETGFQFFEGVNMIMTPRDWAATVGRMREANDCRMEDDEEVIIIDWLNENHG